MARRNPTREGDKADNTYVHIVGFSPAFLAEGHHADAAKLQAMAVFHRIGPQLVLKLDTAFSTDVAQLSTWPCARAAQRAIRRRLGTHFSAKAKFCRGSQTRRSLFGLVDNSNWPPCERGVRSPMQASVLYSDLCPRIFPYIEVANCVEALPTHSLLCSEKAKSSHARDPARAKPVPRRR